MLSTSVACGAVLVSLLDANQATPRLAYVSNERAGTVSVLDVTSDTVLRTIDVGGRPRGLAARFTRLYVAIRDRFQNQQGDADASVAIDAVMGRVTARYDAGTDPERFVLSLDGTQLIAANEEAGTATITELETGEILTTLIVGIEPEGVAISPDGRWVYVTAETSNTVSVVDLKARKVVKSFAVDPRSRMAAFSPDGRRAYVTSEIGSSVSLVDVSQHQVIDVIDSRPPRIPSGSWPLPTAPGCTSPMATATASRSSMRKRGRSTRSFLWGSGRGVWRSARTAPSSIPPMVVERRRLSTQRHVGWCVLSRSATDRGTWPLRVSADDSSDRRQAPPARPPGRPRGSP